MQKRELDVVVISDIHLGTQACRAQELLNYLYSIKPENLILNGDFIDVLQFRKRHFPKEHLQILQHILKMAEEGTKVYYITGNHDDSLRTYSNFSSDNIFLRNQLTIHLNRKKYLIFHGDVFDLSLQYAPFISKLGRFRYDYLIRLNRFINNIRTKLGLAKMSLANKIKNSVKASARFVNDFEEKAIEFAAKKNYDYVICGHIHHPQMRAAKINGRKIMYLNAGDWVENLSALEYKLGVWSIYQYDASDYSELSNQRVSSKLGHKKSTTSIFEQMIQLAT